MPTARELFEDFCADQGITISTATEPPSQPLLTKSGYDLSSVEWTPAQIAVYDALPDQASEVNLISAIMHQLLLVIAA